MPLLPNSLTNSFLGTSHMLWADDGQPSISSLPMLLPSSPTGLKVVPHFSNRGGSSAGGILGVTALLLTRPLEPTPPTTLYTQHPWALWRLTAAVSLWRVCGAARSHARLQVGQGWEQLQKVMGNSRGGISLQFWPGEVHGPGLQVLSHLL